MESKNRKVLGTWAAMAAFILTTTVGLSGCFLGEPQDGDEFDSITGASVTGEDRGDGPVSLLHYIPKTWKPGELLLGQRILEIRDDPYGWVAVIENPFLYREHTMVLPDGSNTGVPCGDEVNLEKQPIEVYFPDGAQHQDLAKGLHDAFFGAAYHGIMTYQFSPMIWHCNEEYSPLWWHAPGEWDALNAALAVDCGYGEESVACEQKKCDVEANYQHTWATRQSNAMLRWDMQAKANIALWFIFENIIVTRMAPEDMEGHDMVVDFMLLSYSGVLGQEGVIEQTFHEIESDRIICRDRALEYPTGVDPSGQAPNCSFTFGLGPVSYSQNADGSWTLAGGGGAIVAVTHYPKTGETLVKVGYGVQGHIGPIGIGLGAGVEIALKDMSMSIFTDPDISAGPLSCSIGN